MNALQLDNISYRFPNTTVDVLRHVNWKAWEGSVNLLVGPSGSGKSTLLSCLNGLIPHFHGGAFAGEARIFGATTLANAPRDLAATVGTVFQDPESQFVTDSVEDEIVFGLENLGYNRRTMRLRLEETLDLLGIQHLRMRQISQISGGERQRVALAAALVTRPQALLLDEPTSQLDPLAAHDILTAVEHLNRDFGTTIIIAEHRLDRVLPFAGEITTIAGANVASGPVETMLDELDDLPPLVEWGKRQGWHPIPLTIRDARRRQGPVTVPPRPPEPTTTGETCLTVQDLEYRYGLHLALRDISFEARRGEIIALAGKNGSGKTTLLRHLMGLIRPNRGTITINGHNTARMKVQEIAAHAGYVPQFPTAILHQETLREEILFTGRARRISVDPENIADHLGIAHLLDRHPLDLSGGERQRSALAAIVAAMPDILLLDEPTRGLPGTDKLRLADYLRRYAASGRLVVVATHDVEFLAQCANRVIMLADGELIADGQPADVLSGSLTFGTQMNRLFGGHILTLDDALDLARD